MTLAKLWCEITFDEKWRHQNFKVPANRNYGCEPATGTPISKFTKKPSIPRKETEF